MKQLDEETKKLAIDWAEKIFNDIERASHDPLAKLEGDSLKVYEELKTWGWFDRMPLDVDGDKTVADSHMIYIQMLAMDKYRRIDWAKKHPPKEKPSRWEFFTRRTSGIKKS